MVKVKLSPCFHRALRYEGVLGSEGIAQRILNLGNRGGVEWSASRPGRFTPRERAPLKSSFSRGSDVI
jgi:hypothetical protein